jgi:O-antigen/teichoic acid export membrane protein
MDFDTAAVTHTSSPSQDFTNAVSSGSGRTAFLSFAWATLINSSSVQLYYGAGLGIQKGLPFLLIPILVHFYGDRTYASYVLFYNSVQVFAAVSTLAIPGSVIVFWYREDSKPRLVITYVTLILGSLIIVGSFSSLPLYHIYRSSFPRVLPGQLTVLGFLFMGLYACNMFLVSFCRATNRSRQFFIAQLIAAGVLVIAVLPRSQPASLTMLIGAFMTAWLVQDIYLGWELKRYLAAPILRSYNSRLASEVLRFSLPLVIYNVAVLAAFWVDKYMVCIYFDPQQFAQFVLTFQYAFAQAFFGQVLSFYTFPLICRLLTTGDSAQLWRVVHVYDVLLVGIGLVYSAGLLAVHFWIYRLNINIFGFVLLSMAFVTDNVCVNYINVLFASRKTGLTMQIRLMGVAILAGVLALGCLLRRIELCYGSHLLMYGLLTAIFIRSAKRLSPPGGATMIQELEPFGTAG